MTSGPWLLHTPHRTAAALRYLPGLDVARGVVAGYEATTTQGVSAEVVAEVVAGGLAAASTLPPNTFLTLPVPGRALADDTVTALLRGHGDLSGFVLDLRELPDELTPALLRPVDALRSAGALLALGGEGVAQPALSSVIRLRPSIIRLGRAWVDGIERSDERRSAVEVTGSMAAQLDAWILAESVTSAAELRTLAELRVPLAQGPLVGAAHGVWQGPSPQVRQALPRASRPADGVLRSLLQRAYTTEDADAAQAVLPDATGYQVVVAVDEHRRPCSLLVRDGVGRWDAVEALTVHVDTAVADVVARALARPRPTRFAPVVCTDTAGGLLGVLHLEDLVQHLAARA